MSHYPTSAELASFRAAAHNATIAEVERITGRPVMAFVHPSASPAFPSELRHGIGHSPDAERIWQRDGWSVGDAARREASRMRSRAYYRLSHDPATEPMLPVLDLLHPDGAYFGPWYEETSYGAPYTWNVCECCGNPHTYCDCYGIAV